MVENKTDLIKWGWTERESGLAEFYQEQSEKTLLPGRIVFQGRHLYRMVTENGIVQGQVSGRFRKENTHIEDFPAIGDWVLFNQDSEHSPGIINNVLPRRSRMCRNNAGETTEEQIISSNLDFLFLVFAIDGERNFTVRGLERYMTQAWESGAQPVVILNKKDLCDDPDAALELAEGIALGAPVLLTSALNKEGVDQLEPYLGEGKTITLIGPSGVGKSELTNALLGNQQQKTNATRKGDHRGKHTTTNKEMFMLPSGALLIDCPGIKEVQLWADESSLDSAFPEIEELKQQCKFRDCQHQGEPGCAVQDAINNGALEYDRYLGYLDLQREIRFLERKVSAQERRNRDSKGKAIAKFIRQKQKFQADNER